MRGFAYLSVARRSLSKLDLNLRESRSSYLLGVERAQTHTNVGVPKFGTLFGTLFRAPLRTRLSTAGVHCEGAVYSQCTLPPPLTSFAAPH